ncbi:MAG: hypothetical protein DRJ65_05530 [Acidobacteria bacterium]|nr:MAG: hypothetical protein DRJ65_05530 [Acidobacteriota bacterium]
MRSRPRPGSHPRSRSRPGIQPRPSGEPPALPLGAFPQEATLFAVGEETPLEEMTSAAYGVG